MFDALNAKIPSQGINSNSKNYEVSYFYIYLNRHFALCAFVNYTYLLFFLESIQ